ncbi:MAG TPA: rhombosortase [Gammaproteobacteria bacterium]|nr:rhombosortase [Gammaproteobacteria bacterium]
MNDTLKRLRPWAFPLVVSVLALFFQATGLDLTLRYDREAIQHGAWWLLLTGNLAHLSWGHVVLNLAGLWMVWWFFIGEFTDRQWLVIFVVSGLFVTTGLYLFNPRLIWYVGLSGLLHGLFIAGGLKLLFSDFRFAAALLVVIVAKLAYEQTVGSMPGTSEMSGGPVVVNAHLFGSIGGLAAFLLLEAGKRITGRRLRHESS